MGKSFDAIMEIVQKEGKIDDDKAKEIIAEHGPLSDDEKKQVASAIKMKKALEGKDEGKKDADEVSMDDYIRALSVLDSEGASEEEKKKAEEIKAKFEG
jgi:hypothetical protein